MSIPLTVFVVDDDEAVRDAIDGMLRLLGYSVRSFASVEAFLECSVAASAGCVLVDVRMPGMGGVELCRELRRREIPLPTIFMTGHADETSQQNASDTKIIAILQKPFSTKQLVDVVNRSLSGFTEATA
jgi:FixJ family two-component response regulator